MITPDQIHLNYIKKEAQTGSDSGMRYRLCKSKNEDGDCIEAAVWPEPFCFVKTPEKQKTFRQFPLNEEAAGRRSCGLTSNTRAEAGRQSARCFSGVVPPRAKLRRRRNDQLTSIGI